MLGFVVRRATLLAAVVGLGCSEQLLPPEVLTDHPVLLAWRTVVVEEGVHSQWVLPLPADRTRSQPLPLDTIEVTPMFADNTGIRDAADFDLQWFVCGNSQTSCISSLNEMGAGPKPCGGVFPETVCQLPSGPRVRYALPEHGEWSSSAGLMTFAFVGALPGGRFTTQQCADRAASVSLRYPEYPELRDCLLGYVLIKLGPEVVLGYLYRQLYGGLDPDTQELPLPYSPAPGNPELRMLRFLQCTHPECATRQALGQALSEAVRIPTGSGLLFRGFDPGDLAGSIHVYPTDLDGWDPRRKMIVAPSDPTTMLFVATQGSAATGQIWAEFEVEVYRP